MDEFRYYHFKRYRHGKEKAEGAVTQARDLTEALGKVQSWYSIYDSFRLTHTTPCLPSGEAKP